MLLIETLVSVLCILSSFPYAFVYHCKYYVANARIFAARKKKHNAFLVYVLRSVTRFNITHSLDENDNDDELYVNCLCWLIHYYYYYYII